MEKGRRRGEEEEKAQSEKREAVAAFRGRERERIIAASGRPGLRSRALIGCFEEDETSGRTARPGRVAGLHWHGGKGIAHRHMGTRSVRSIAANFVGFVLDPGGQRWRFCLCFRAG